MTMQRETSPVAAAAPAKAKPTKEMNKLMEHVLNEPENQVCADCPTKKPLWVSYLATLPTGGPKRMAVLLCPECARRHHYELGDKRCRIHYLKMAHEFDLEAVRTLEQTGNAVVNRVLEGLWTKDVFDKELVLEDADEEDERRSKYIKYKYKKHQYKEPTLYQDLMHKLLFPKEEKTKHHEKPHESYHGATKSKEQSKHTDSSSSSRGRTHDNHHSHKNSGTPSTSSSVSRESTQHEIATIGATKSKESSSHSNHKRSSVDTKQEQPRRMLRRVSSCSKLQAKPLQEQPIKPLMVRSSSSSRLSLDKKEQTHSTSSHKHNSKTKEASLSTRSDHSTAVSTKSHSPAPSDRRKEARRRVAAAANAIGTATKSHIRSSSRSRRLHERSMAVDKEKETPRRQMLRRGSSCSKLHAKPLEEVAPTLVRSSSSSRLFLGNDSSQKEPESVLHRLKTEKHHNHHRHHQHSKESSLSRKSKEVTTRSTERPSNTIRSNHSNHSRSKRHERDTLVKESKRKEGSRRLQRTVKLSGSCRHLVVDTTTPALAPLAASASRSSEKQSCPDLNALKKDADAAVTKESNDRVRIRTISPKKNTSSSRLETANPSLRIRPSRRHPAPSISSNLLVAAADAGSQELSLTGGMKKVPSGTSVPDTTSSASELLLRINRPRRQAMLHNSSPNLMDSMKQSDLHSKKNAVWEAKAPARQKLNHMMPYVKKTVRSIADPETAETKMGHHDAEC